MKKYLSSVVIVLALLNGAGMAYAASVMDNIDSYAPKPLQTYWKITPVPRAAHISRVGGLVNKECEYPDENSCYASNCTKSGIDECDACDDGSYACVRHY